MQWTLPPVKPVYTKVLREKYINIWKFEYSFKKKSYQIRSIVNYKTYAGPLDDHV